MITLDYSGIQLKFRQEQEKTLVFDMIRKRWMVLTPEEHVRQYLVHYLVTNMSYPAGMIALEKRIVVGGLDKRFDLIVYDREHKPWMLVECKEPEVIISEQTLHQLLNYQRTAQCSYWLLTNGHQTYCADACDIQVIRWMDQLPPYQF